MQPRPTGKTSSSVPSLRVCITRLLVVMRQRLAPCLAFDNRLILAQAVPRNRSMNRAHLSQLAVLATVAQCGSFRGAARELAIAPSAVSHAVSSLEARLGVRLLARSTRSVAPTEEGAQLLERLRPALSEIDLALETAVEARDRPAGNLRLSVPRTAAHLVLTPRLGAFASGLSRHRAGDRHRGPLHRCGRRRFRCRCAAWREPAARHDRGAHRAGPSRRGGRRAILFRGEPQAAPPARPCRPSLHPLPLLQRHPLPLGIRKGRRGDRDRRARAADPRRGPSDRPGGGRRRRARLRLRALCPRAARRRQADPRAGGLVPGLRRVLRLLSEPPADAAGAAGRLWISSR